MDTSLRKIKYTLAMLCSLCFLVLLVNACSTSEGEQTVVAQLGIANRDLRDLQTTATVQAARMQTTRSFFDARMTKAVEQRAFLFATLEARGTVFLTPTATPIPETATPTPLPPTATYTPFPTSTLTTTVIEDMVAARSINQGNGCAREVTTEFTTEDDEIYVVGVAKDIPENASIDVEWIYNGEVVSTFSLAYGSYIRELCVWFSLTEEDTELLPGFWNVSLTISTVPGNYLVVFQIVDDAEETPEATAEVTEEVDDSDT